MTENRSCRETPLLASLRQAGLILRETDRHVVIRCPFSDDDHEAVYHKPTTTYDIGSFECPACAGRTVYDLLSKLNLSPSDARDCPRIPITLLLHELVSAGRQVLARAKGVFVNGSDFVRVNPETGEVKFMTEADIAVELSKGAIWLSRDGKEVDLPQSKVHTIFTESEHSGLKVLNGVMRHPILDESGMLIMRPGYDDARGLYAAFDPASFADQSWTSVSRADAIDSVRRIQDAFLGEFRFADEIDKSAALAVLMTAVVRQQLDAAPMVFISALTPGSGKTTLSLLCGALASGSYPPGATKVRDEQEILRMITSMLRGLPPVLMFDNVQKLSDDPTLCAILSMPRHTSRAIRTSNMITTTTRTLVVMNGNLREIPGDLRRRTLSVWLDAGTHAPLREFGHEKLIDELLAKRPKVVSDLLKISAAYLQAGCPKMSCVPLAGYVDWTRTVRNPLVWLDYPDPAMRTIMQLTEVDPSDLPIIAFAETLWRLFGNKKFCVKDIADHSEDLQSVLTPLGVLDGGVLNRRSLGWILRTSVGSRLGRLVIRRLGQKAVYMLELSG